MSFGFGIIGCGTISDFHARAIESLADGQVVACYSRSTETARQFADAHHCAMHQTLDDLLADSRVDIVSICTPSGAHLDPAIAAAKAGKHVVIEKPLEITTDRCDAIIGACHESGVVLSTIFQSRFHEAARELKRAIENQRFGKLVLGNAYVKWFRTQAYYDSGAWRGTWELDGGGALMNQAIHSIDLLIWLMGPVESVSAMTGTLTHERIEVEDTAIVNLRFANGAFGTIEATTSAFPGSLKKIGVYGSEGSAVIEEESIKLWQFAETDPDDTVIVEKFSAKSDSGGGASDPKAISFAAHATQFADVIDAIKSGRQPFVDGHEARKSVALIQAIYQSARTGKTVSFPAN